MKKNLPQTVPKDIDYNNLTVQKSNEFISASYKSSLLAEKLVAIAITRLNVEKNDLVAVIFSSELKAMLGKKDGDDHIYTDLRDVSKEMTSTVIQIEDRNKSEFETFSMITNAVYKNGKFFIKFNSSMAPHIFNLKNKYTSYSLAVTLKMTSPYTYRIYELIKEDAFYIKKYNTRYYTRKYNVSCLKFKIGVLDIDDPGAQEARRKGGSWDDMADACIKKKMTSWSNFRVRVLDRAKAELDEFGDVTFDYDTIRVGHGGKVVAVNFYIYNNDEVGDISKRQILEKKDLVEQKNREYEKIVDVEEIIPIPDILQSYEGHNGLTHDNLVKIFEASDNDASKAIDAIKMADDTSKHSAIKNYVGWIISCLKDGYNKQPVIDGSAERGDRVEKAKEILNNREKMKKAGDTFWNNLKDQKPENFMRFLDYLESNGRTLDMFEATYGDKCADKFIEWSKNPDHDIDLI